MRSFVLITLLLLVKCTFGQDLTGIWRGSFSSSDRITQLLNLDDRYKYEVQIDQKNKGFNGVTYSYKTTVFYGKASANGTINPKTGKVLLTEIKMMEIKMQQGSDACLQTFMLQYSKNGNEEFLEGKYTSYNEKDSSLCGRGTVLLRKVPTSDFHKEPFLVERENEKLKKKVPAVVPPKTSAAPATKNPAPKAVAKSPVTKNPASNTIVKTPPTKAPVTTKPVITKPPVKSPVTKTVPQSSDPSGNTTIPDIAKTDTFSKGVPSIKKTIPLTLPRELATRENELIKTITVNANEVSINIYDNGTIDHDTVSVFLDKKLVVSRQMLTTSPISLKLNLNEDNAYHELVMVAENLGDIPPNTSLMVVKSGDKVYEVRITSTQQKNAVIVFKYEPAGK